MRILLSIFFSLSLLSLSSQTNHHYYISPTGNDTNDGLSETSPFATLEKARDQARLITGNSNITIWLLDGDYYLNQTFELNAADSGSDTKTITYKAQNKHQAKLHLNRDIPITDFQDITDSALTNRMRPEAVGKIKVLDLSTMNLTNINTWADYFPANNQELIRIYAGEEQLQLSQFPNDTMMTMQTVTQNEPGIFKFRGTRHHNWLEAVNDGLWFQGYWRVAWQFDAVRTSAIDTINGLVYQATSVPLGIGSKYHRPAGNGEEPYRAINLLEEIDLPGEWCVHFNTQKLYIWIPDNVNEIQLLDLKQPIIKVKDVSNTTFMDLDISYSLGQGITIENGDGNLIAGCNISKVIDDAVQIINGTNHTVQSNDLHHLGAGGILLSGGNRDGLIPANHSAINNHIYEFGQVKVIYAPAVYTPGRYEDNNVGMYVAHNEIHGTPHVGILYSGNNHIFEYNNIYDICRVSNDMGAFYSHGDWSSYGSIIRYNYMHDAENAHGAYFDDGDSGDEVYDNIMSHIDVGVFIGGGHDNIVTGNLAVNCEKTVHVDNRGVSRGYNLDNTTYVNRVTSVDYQNPPWSTQYPSIVNILDPSYSQELPVGNNIDCNVALNTGQVVDIDAQTALDWEVILGTNYTDTDASISNPATTDLQAILDATGYNGENCMNSVNWDMVGLIEDEYRSLDDCAFDVNTDEVSVLANDFIIQGNASIQSNTCLELTADAYHKTGAIWHPSQLNLNEDFELNFEINLGTRGAGGANGMIFILQSSSSMTEATSGTIGFSGMDSSIGIEFDTYSDGSLFDPNNDHISIQKNGNLKHNASGYLDATVRKNPTTNMEDGNFHSVKITWNAATKELTYLYDGNETATVTQDIVNTIFAGNPNVFFGWSANTTAKRNQHQVCTNGLFFKESIMVHATVTDFSCDNSGYIELEVTGGTAPYSYAWSNGTYTPNLIFVDEPGTYTVIIEDDCNNWVTETYTILDDCSESCVYEKVKNNTFEGGWGAWNDGGDNCERILSSGIGTDGNWSVRLRNGTNSSVTTSDNFDMSAYTEAEITFKYQCRSMDNASEGFHLEMSIDGGNTFTFVEEWNRDDEFCEYRQLYRNGSCFWTI